LRGILGITTLAHSGFAYLNKKQFIVEIAFILSEGSGNDASQCAWVEASATYGFEETCEPVRRNAEANGRYGFF
jgi:hypothetical protein